MRIKPELMSRIRYLRYAVDDAFQCAPKNVPAPCRYFDAFTSGNKAVKVSCANCRAERMVIFDNGLDNVDCYTLMILDFLKNCGVEVEDES